MSSATFRRGVAAAGLLSTAALSLLSVVLQPQFPAGFAQRLTALDEAGTRGAVSAFAFVAAQLPLIVGLLGVAHLLRGRSPVLSVVATLLGVTGAFGHAVLGGISLVYLTMASDPAHRATYAVLMKQVESSPAMLFAALGLAGTVLGVLLLGVALWRSRVAPRWIPVALWVFLVVEFAGSNLSRYASAVSGLVFLASFAALAVWVARTPRAAWEVAVQAPAREPVPA